MVSRSCFFVLTAILVALPVSAQEATPRDIVARPVWVGANIAKGKTVWVLAIGVNVYQKGNDLDFCRRDALAVGQAFREVGLVPDSHVEVLTDAKGPLDTKSIKAGIVRVLGKAKAGDTLIVHFSGHGDPVVGKLYLTSSTYDPKRPAATGIDVDWLKTQLAGCKAGSKLVFLDACYSGGFNKDAKEVDGVALAAKFKRLANTVTITSSSNLQPSHELAALKHGIFTYWLVRGLRGGANTKIDKQIDINELFAYLQEHVPATALKAVRRKQTPTWTFIRQAGLPKVIDLFRPDKPSLLVPVANYPLPPDPFVMKTTLDTISRFPQANPYKNIGLAKWVLKHAEPNSELAKLALAHIEAIDKQILAGKLQLDETRE